jgi:hypothetical protein
MTAKVEVNDQGIELSYIDSGPPEGVESYRTLIAFHGYLWSSGMHPCSFVPSVLMRRCLR